MTTTAPSPERAGAREWAALAVVLLAAFIGQVDLFVVTIASPSLQADLDAEFEQIQWVIDAYVLAFAAGVVTAGRLGDRVGRRRVFLAGVVAFTAASVGCAVCPSVEWLIAARVVQGLAAALLMPQVLALIRATFLDPRQRQRAVGLYGTVIGLGVIGGLAGGGLLLALDPGGLGWRIVFLINVPVGLLILAAHRVIAESRNPHPARLDLTGAALTAVVLPATLVALTLAGSSTATGWAVVALLSTAAAATATLVAHQRRLATRGGDPLWSPAVLTTPGIPRWLTVAVVFYSGNAALFLALSYHLQHRLEVDAFVAGAVFLPLGLGFAISSALSHHAGTRPVLAGALLMVGGLLALSAATHTPPPDQPAILAGAIAVCGLGQGLVVAPLVTQVLALAPVRHAGAASGVLNTTTQASMALGIAAGGLAYHAAGLTATALLLTGIAALVATLSPKP